MQENPEECPKKYSLDEGELVSYACPIAADGIAIQERNGIEQYWNEVLESPSLLGEVQPSVLACRRIPWSVHQITEQQQYNKNRERLGWDGKEDMGIWDNPMKKEPRKVGQVACIDE